MFSPDGTLISAFAAPDCGATANTGKTKVRFFGEMQENEPLQEIRDKVTEHLHRFEHT